MSNPVAPDASKTPGTPPVGGAGGERGSSAFVADAMYNTDGTVKDGVVPPHSYPLHGVDYYPGSTYTGMHSA